MKRTELKHALVDQICAQHLAIVGKVGSGKTYLAKGLVEQLLDEKRRICILDPTGAWFGLRSSADGKKAGYPVVVFGGLHADVPINERAGDALAKILGEKNVPAIVDLSELLLSQRQRFVADFAEGLYRYNRTPLHLVVDEADEFCPQNPLPETKRMLGHMDRIVRRGRIRGFRVMLISQRPAVLHKNVLTQANTLIAMRLTAPQDRKAIEAWVQGQADDAKSKEVLSSLANLQRGEGWIWSPEFDVLQVSKFPQISTYDSSRAPEWNDSKLLTPTKLAAVDLSEITASFAEIENEAKSLADLKTDNAALRKRVADLERASSAGGLPQRAVDAAIREARAPLQAENKILRAVLKPTTESLGKIRDLAVAAIAAAVVDAVESVPPRADAVLSRALKKHAPFKVGDTVTVFKNDRRHAIVTRAGDSALPKGELSMLTAVAQQGDAGATRLMLGVLTEYKKSTRDLYIQLLQRKGFVEIDRGLVIVTSAGLDALGPHFEPLPTGAALREHWLSRLPGGEAQVLRFLATNFPNHIEREQIGDATGYKKSTRDLYLQKLAARALIETERGAARASPLLFD